MTWFEPTLYHGPKLIHQRPDRDDPALDVTDRPCEFLFAQLGLADDAHACAAQWNTFLDTIGSFADDHTTL